MGNILQNRVLFSGLIAMVLAQALKPVVHWCCTKEWDPVQGFSSGGMPSSHSAFVSAAAISAGLVNGFDSTVFAVAVTFAIVVIYDAANVRWQSGLHAQRINQILREMFKGQMPGEAELKEVIGHTPKQVYFGIALGLAVGVLITEIWPL